MKLKLHWQILIALLLALVFGMIFSEDSALLGVKLVSVYEFVGTLFLSALKMLVVPLIVAAIISGMAEIGKSEGFARLGIKTILYYSMTSFLAIMVGLVMVNLFTPGIVDGEPAKELIGLSDTSDETLERVGSKGVGDIVEVFLRMVPPNIVRAAAEGQMLGLITFSLLFGFFMTQLNERASGLLKEFWQAIYDVMIGITNLVMRFAPIGVFGLVAKTVTLTGVSAIKPLAGFFFTVLIALAIHAMITLPILLRFIAAVNPLHHARAMSSALLTAFSTSSSAATLPKTIECITQRVGVSRKVTSFTLPLGATVNMDGTALYECVAALFIAQAYGMELTFGVQLTVVITALLTSIGVAGIPSASLVAIIIILKAVGLPLEGIGLILVVDRILDMCRTTVNVFSDSVGAVLIAKSEGETEILVAEKS